MEHNGASNTINVGIQASVTVYSGAERLLRCVSCLWEESNVSMMRRERVRIPTHVYFKPSF